MTADFSDLLDDSIEVAQSAGPSQALSSTNLKTSNRDTSEDVPEAVTFPYRSTAPKWLSDRPTSAASIAGGERSSVFFATKPTSSNEFLTGTLGSREKKEAFNSGPTNKADQGASEPTVQLSSGISIASTAVAATSQNIVHSNAPSEPQSPSAGNLLNGTPGINARQTLTPQTITGEAASDMYPTKSDVETTAFAVALTRETGAEGHSQAREPLGEGPAVAPLSNQYQAPMVGKAPVAEPPDGASTNSFAVGDSDSELSSDRSIGNTISSSFISAASGSQNSPRLRSTDVSSQSGAAMDATKLHSAGLIGLAPGNTNRSISGPINDSPMSSSNAMQPMEGHEMHVSGAPKTDLTVRIQGDAGQSVNLRVVERAGQIQVSVRTNDPVTAAMLRREVPALQAGLERIGWHANPITHALQQPGEARSSEEQTHSQHRKGDENSHSDQQQQRPRSGAADQWLELMHREN